MFQTPEPFAFVELVAGALDARQWAFVDQGAAGRFHRVLVLESGSLSVDGVPMPGRLGGPAMLWKPHGGDWRLTLSAGARGALLSLPDRHIAGASLAVSSAALSQLVQRLLVIPSLDRHELERASHAIDIIATEGNDRDGLSEVVVSTQVTYLMTLLWRGALRRGLVMEPAATDLALLQRFRNLVELHFREQRPVAYYADVLGVMPDRLHALCTRSLGRSPLRLINDRVVQEAARELEIGARSIGEIAHRLGFKDRSYFGRFFLKRMGVTPRQHRLDSQVADRVRFVGRYGNFADWP